MISMVGLDAVIFLRFMRMLRYMFIVLTILGLAVVLPVCLAGDHLNSGPTTVSKRQDPSAGDNSYGKISFLTKLTPQYSFGPRFWAYTILAYAFDAIVCGFIWWNYRAIVRMRRAYLQSSDYQSSLHARTLMITHVPPALRTDDGLIRIAADTNASRETPKTAIARNVKDLPELIEEHDEAVRALEKVLAKYLSNPDRLPAKRPTCKPSKRDRARDSSREVDAIEYLTGRIREIEREVMEVRESIDKRNPMPFGFACYTRIEDAHVVAFAARKKGPQGTTIRLAPKPNDIIWKNIGMSPKTRRTRSVWNGIWMVLLTIAYIIPNILTAVFLSDFANLASVWKGFGGTYYQHPKLWGVLQGILAPLIQALFYLALPIIFRRLLSKSGDPTKTSRERHVASRLFGFYMFNQLIVFSLFASVWRFIASVIQAGTTNKDVWDTIKNYHIFAHLVVGLCNTSPFWITWALQRNLGAAVDLSQLWPLIWGSVVRKLSSPTPRENIELSAPVPFDYASYYNNYLFTATIGLCFATLNPIILPITAVFLVLDSWLKKYMLLYIAITKVESAGMFWRMAINRLLIGLLISNIVIALIVASQGVVLIQSAASGSAAMLYAMVPLPFLILGFKLYLRHTFDDKIRYYKTKAGMVDMEAPMEPSDKKAHHHRDRLGVRFGDPALWRKLKTPMVSAKAQHVLPQIYTGRTDANEMAAMRAAAFGQADVYMANMDNQAPGKATKSSAPFELVGESEQDFEYFKRRAEFREEFGGEGELYSRPSSRATSLASMSTLMGPGGLPHMRKGSDSPSSSRASSRTRAADDAAGVTYPHGYAAPMRAESPSALYRQDSGDITAAGHPAFRGNDSRERLTDFAGGMGTGTPTGYAPYRPDSPGGYRGAGGYTPGQYSDGPRYGSNGGTPYEDDNTSYDYFRRGRQTGR